MSIVIGISADYRREKKGNYPNEISLDLVAGHIGQAVIEAGAIPVILPTANQKIARQYAGVIDGLILSGGYDVDPYFYQEDLFVLTGETCPERDRSELAIADEMLKQKKPILGICRGLQVINSLYGGTLYQDQSYHPEAYLKHVQETPMKNTTHQVKITEGSYLEKLMGKELAVNSLHHQSIKEVGSGLKSVALSKDGVVEAVEAVNDKESVLAVQWHPEDLFKHERLQFNLFSDLVERSNKAKLD